MEIGKFIIVHEDHMSLLAFMGSYTYWRKANQLTSHFKLYSAKKHNSLDKEDHLLRIVTVWLSTQDCLK